MPLTCTQKKFSLNGRFVQVTKRDRKELEEALAKDRKEYLFERKIRRELSLTSAKSEEEFGPRFGEL